MARYLVIIPALRIGRRWRSAMSFSVSFSCGKTEIETKLGESSAASVPEGVKQFIRDACKALKSNNVSVSAYGHLHDSNSGDVEESTCTIKVRPVE
jgi:hypothetical protein